MKIRVTAWIGNHRWWWDFSGEKMDMLATQQANSLIREGFRTTSKAGVVTFHLPHRITKITARQIRA